VNHAVTAGQKYDVAPRARPAKLSASKRVMTILRNKCTDRGPINVKYDSLMNTVQFM
jgi:hypothetical protein